MHRGSDLQCACITGLLLLTPPGKNASNTIDQASLIRHKHRNHMLFLACLQGLALCNINVIALLQGVAVSWSGGKLWFPDMEQLLKRMHPHTAAEHLHTATEQTSGKGLRLLRNTDLVSSLLNSCRSCLLTGDKYSSTGLSANLAW